MRAIRSALAVAMAAARAAASASARAAASASARLLAAAAAGLTRCWPGRAVAEDATAGDELTATVAAARPTITAVVRQRRQSAFITGTPSLRDCGHIVRHEPGWSCCSGLDGCLAAEVSARTRYRSGGRDPVPVRREEPGTGQEGGTRCRSGGRDPAPVRRDAANPTPGQSAPGWREQIVRRVLALAPLPGWGSWG